jgi:hypothetical protein
MKRQPQPPSIPASTAVPTAATEQQNEKYNDEERGGIHVGPPRNAAYCAAWNSDFFDNVEPVVRFQEPTWRDGTGMTPAPRCSSWRMGTRNCHRNCTALTSASQSGRQRNFPHISQECPPMAALCDSVVSLQTSNLRPRRSNLPIVSGGCPENSARERRRLETRVRSHYLAGMVVARCRFLLRGQYSG